MLVILALNREAENIVTVDAPNRFLGGSKMLSSGALSYLNQLVSEEQYKANQREPYVRIKEIHVGYVHVDLESEFARASQLKEKFMLCEINGVPIILNSLCEGGYKVIFKESDIPKEIIIGGIRPSKTWLKRYGIIKR